MRGDQSAAWLLRWRELERSGRLVSVFPPGEDSSFSLGFPVGSSATFWVIRRVDRDGARGDLMVSPWRLIGLLRPEDSYHQIFESATWASEPRMAQVEHWLTWRDVLLDPRIQAHPVSLELRGEHDCEGRIGEVRETDFQILGESDEAAGEVAIVPYASIKWLEVRVPSDWRSVPL